MFGRKAKPKPTRSKESDLPDDSRRVGKAPARDTNRSRTRPNPNTASSTDAAVDFGASLLREIGDTLIGTDVDAIAEDQEAFDRWALHLLIRTPPPGQEAASGDRDFKGARQHARMRLNEQQRRVTSTVDGLRGVIDTFTEKFSLTLRDDIRSDRMAHGALSNLREAAQHDDTSALKTAALSAISQLSVALEDKRTNHRLFAASMAEKISPIREEVDRARKAPTVDPETGLLDRHDFELSAKVGEEAMALFLESSVVVVVEVDASVAPKEVGDGLSRVFPRRRDFVGRMDTRTYAAVARDCEDVDRARFLQRVRERVPGVVKAAAATTREDDGPTALVRALDAVSTSGPPGDVEMISHRGD